LVRLEGASHLPVDQPLLSGGLVHPHPVNVALEAPSTQRNLESVLDHRLAAPVLQRPPLPTFDVLQGATGDLGSLRHNLIDGVLNGLSKFLINLIDERERLLGPLID